MLLGGDELGRTQGGNNNAWCQDNEISWFDWEPRRGARASCSRSRERLIALRREHPVFRRRQFLRGDATSEGSGLPDVWWFRPDGRRMTQRDWRVRRARRSGMFLNGEEIADADAARASAIVDDSFLLLFNAHHEDVDVHAADRRFGERWALELSTAEPEARAGLARGRGAREDDRGHRALAGAAARGRST